MRTLLIAGTAMAGLLGAGAASAGERMVQRGPGMGGVGWNAPRPASQPMPQAGRPAAPQMNHAGWNAPRPNPRPMPQIGQQRGPRWGSKVGGRWWGGANAPGGWNAYRRPVRGWSLPSYWNTPRFYVSDWSNYGLWQPQGGYNWVRYYDDAVLIDGRGSVYDSVSNVDWDGYDAAAGYDDDQVYADAYRGGEPPVAPDYGDYDHRDDGRGYERRDNGLGGAAIGAVAGGVAGNLIGGRGNRLGGTLIGAGVGAAAGYAIDKAEDRGRGAPPPPQGGYGDGYPQPGYAQHGYAPAPRPYPPVAPSGHWVSPDGGTTVVTSGGGYGYGGSVTTVTVQTAPVVTTTTTEIYEDHVTWSRPARKTAWKPKRKVVCGCR